MLGESSSRSLLVSTFEANLVLWKLVKSGIIISNFLSFGSCDTISLSCNSSLCIMSF